MTPRDQCNHCAEPIRWMTTSAGKQMPVNAQPDPARGNVVRLGGAVGVLGPKQAAAARARGVELYLHHVVTCPYADRWRSKSTNQKGAARERPGDPVGPAAAHRRDRYEGSATRAR